MATAMPTAIEWTDETWNPVTGCTKVSPGCKHCYAERFAERFRGTPGHPFAQGFDPDPAPRAARPAFRWRTPRMVFVNSMSDLFGEFVPDDYIEKVFEVMRATPQHTYQVLTKRADRMNGVGRTAGRGWPGAATSGWACRWRTRSYGLPRIDLLRDTKAAVRFLSVEPLLEALAALDLAGIHWVIVGGESGPGARPIDPRWVRSIRDRCRRAGVPFFFKQWGGVTEARHGAACSTGGPGTRSRRRCRAPGEGGANARVRGVVPVHEVEA